MAINGTKVSVIIPLYNEPKAAKNIHLIEEELKKSFKRYEIICVNDGSRDKTESLLNGYHSSKIKVYSYPMNIGKGFALCFGFTQSTGELVAFFDADLDIHPKHIRLYADLMDLVEADVVIGSKRHQLSRVKYPLNRKVYSFVYQKLIKLLFGLNLTDTQVGVKLFRRKVLQRVIPRLLVKQWAFDLELLVVASHLGFKRIIEAPVEIKLRSFGSKINSQAVYRTLVDTAAIFYRCHLLRFYDQKRRVRPYQAKVAQLKSE
jgi:glycosyltransferase involved in cell wall biosynthesis